MKLSRWSILILIIKKMDTCKCFKRTKQMTSPSDPRPPSETALKLECISLNKQKEMWLADTLVALSGCFLVACHDRGWSDRPGQLPTIQRLWSSNCHQRHGGPLYRYHQGEGSCSPCASSQPHIQTQPLQRGLGHQHNQHLCWRHACSRGQPPQFHRCWGWRGEHQ